MFPLKIWIVSHDEIQRFSTVSNFYLMIEKPDCSQGVTTHIKIVVVDELVACFMDSDAHRSSSRMNYDGFAKTWSKEEIHIRGIRNGLK